MSDRIWLNTMNGAVGRRRRFGRLWFSGTCLERNVQQGSRSDAYDIAGFQINVTRKGVTTVVLRKQSAQCRLVRRPEEVVQQGSDP